MEAMQFEILTSLSSTDKNQILDLFIESFELKDQNSINHFISFLENEQPKKYGVVRMLHKEIVGVISLIDRSVFYAEIECKVAGLSYMAIRMQYKDPEIRRLLVEGMFNYTNNYADILIGFARKKMDGFWYRFGFLGFTNFGKISVELKHLPGLDTRLYIEDSPVIDSGQLEKFRMQSYQALSLFFKRSQNDWDTIINRLEKSNQKIELIKDEKKESVGYMIRAGNNIEELSVDLAKMAQVPSLLRRTLIAENAENTFIELQIGIHHPFAHFIYHNYAHSISTRFVWNGGHILKVSDLNSFLNKIKPALEKRLRDVMIDHFDITLFFVNFKSAGNGLQLKVDHKQDNYNINEMLFWQKLIFGVVDAEILCENSGLSKYDRLVIKTMFPFLQPQVPLFDQF